MYFWYIISLVIVFQRHLHVKRLSLDPVFNKYLGKYTFFKKNIVLKVKLYKTKKYKKENYIYRIRFENSKKTKKYLQVEVNIYKKSIFM